MLDRSTFAIAAAWTDQRIDLLRRLWAEGLSAGKIAKEMGGVSRSAIIGKARRLQLAGRKVGAPAGIEKTKKTHPRIQIYSERKRKSPLRKPPATIIDLFTNAPPIDQRKSILELTNETCRWPYGDPVKPDFFYCGIAESDFAAHRPYCRYHTFIACAPARAPSLVPQKAA